MTRSRLSLWGIVLGFVVAYPLSAQTAFTTKTANLRAGPSKDYPVVELIPPDTEVSVAGCVADWSWCDVIVGDDRGWVYAGNLVSPYEDRRVVILSDGYYVGFPIVTFDVGPYWDHYYRGRPWYGRRSYWVTRPSLVFRPRPGQPSVSRHPVSRPSSRPEVRPEVRRSQPERVRPSGDRARAPRPKPQPARPEVRKPSKEKHSP